MEQLRFEDSGDYEPSDWVNPYKGEGVMTDEQRRAELVTELERNERQRIYLLELLRDIDERTGNLPTDIQAS